MQKQSTYSNNENIFNNIATEIQLVGSGRVEFMQTLPLLCGGSEAVSERPSAQVLHVHVQRRRETVKET